MSASDGYSGPLVVTSRAQMRSYLAGTLAGRRHGWAHLHIRHNSVARSGPCRFCEGLAEPPIGPALFWDGDPVCSGCGFMIAPELTAYLRILQALLQRVGGDWRRLQP